MLPDFSALSITSLMIGLAIAAAVITGAGVAVTKRADLIADRTGLGEALIGAVLLGGSTSLAGIATSVSAAWQGHPALAISNAVGGIAVQTAFLAVADLFYRQANLEHAAASPAALSQSALLMSLLAIPLAATSSPEISLLGVHPATVVLMGTYFGGLYLLKRAKEHPMWLPRRTHLTRRDANEEGGEGSSEDSGKEDGSLGGRLSNGRLYSEFVLLAAVLAVSGYLLSGLGITLSERTGLDETAVGGLLTAIVTSLPELVISVTAVRRGALTLAVSGVIGGNAFDTLFLGFSDIAYQRGSIYHQFNAQSSFTVAVTILMTGILLLGLLRREREGVAGIGFEGASIFLLYGAAAVLMF